MPEGATARPSGRWRTPLGLGLALLGVAAAAPANLVPWGARVHALPWAFAAHHSPIVQQLAMMAVPIAVCLLLIISGCLLPRPAAAIERRPEFIPLALGGLLLLEPWLHVAVLGLLAYHAWPGAGDMLLPRLPSSDGGHGWLRMSLYLMIAPISEEFFFRGRLVPWLRVRLDGVSAVTLSALAFACAHGDACQVLVALPVGLLLGALRVSGAGLLPCILAHQAHNALFYIAGPTLVSEPWVGMALSLAGIGYCFLGLLWPGRPRLLHPARLILGALLLVIVLGSGQSWYRSIQNRCWLSAMHRVIAYGGLPDDILLDRVDHQCSWGRISRERRAALAQRLMSEPCRHPDRQTWVLARLDPASVATDDDEIANGSLIAIASCPLHLAEHDEAVRLLAAAHPGTFTRIVSEDPEALTRWLPLPGQSSQFLLILEHCSSWQRQQLLAASEHVFPGQVVPILLQLPAGMITPAERRFVFLHDPQATLDVGRLPPAVRDAWNP